jgi:hypothetical protein
MAEVRAVAEAVRPTGSGERAHRGLRDTVEQRRRDIDRSMAISGWEAFMSRGDYP